MHTDMGTSAGTWFSGQIAKITGTVSDQRECLLCNTGKYQFTDLSLRQDFPCLRIDDLRNKVIFLDVHSCLFLTFKRYTRTGNLCETVDIIRFDSKHIFDIMTHFLCPWLCAKDTCFQLDLIAKSSLVDGLREVCRVRWRTADNGRSQVRHKLQLSLRITGGHRQRQTTHLMGTAVKSRTTGKQTITIADMADILICSAGCHNGSRTALIPDINIFLGIERNHATSCGTAGGLNTNTVF